MALGGVPIGSAKSKEAAMPTDTSMAMGLKTAVGAMAITRAPTMPMMAMLEMNAPTMTVKLTIITTKKNSDAPDSANDEMIFCRKVPSPNFGLAMASPRLSAAAIRLSVPHSIPFTASSHVMANSLFFQLVGIKKSVVAIRTALADQSR